MDAQELYTFLDFALATAELGGRECVRYFRTGLAAENKSPGHGYDPVTTADRAAERVIRERIGERYPDHAISGEELGYRCGKSRFTWFIDPIDGTRSFVSGLLHWATMIALNDGERPVLGVVHQPIVGESFVGSIAGRAQWLRGGTSRTLTARRCDSLSDASVSVTDPRQFTSPYETGVLEKLSGAARDVCYGAECYGSCLVASGQIDVVLEVGLDAHDVQPLIPIVEAAGGVITDWQGRPCQAGGSILACGDRALHDALLRMIA